MSLIFHTLDVFTDRAFGGNPLAVVLDADGLNEAQMQRIAREFNLSETVFVQSASIDGALRRARIFTPTRELPFAGHPTVGTACLLAELGMAPAGPETRIVLEEGVGPVPVMIRREPGVAPYAQLSVAKLPELAPAPVDTETLAAILGLATGDLRYGEEAPRIASCGLPFVLVPLAQPELLAGIALNAALCQRALAGKLAQEILVYARGYDGELRARMFAPAAGVPEDPATGSAAAALAGALASESAQTEGSLRWTVHQGHEMGRPSRLDTEADKHRGKVTAVRVGGHAVRISEGRLLGV